MLTSLKTDMKPELILTKNDFEILLPDSAIYYSDYTLTIPHTLEQIPKDFSGRFQFTLMPNKNQMWSIVRWIDVSVENETLKPTWSILKASFAN